MEGSQWEKRLPTPTNQEKPPQPKLSQVIALTFQIILNQPDGQTAIKKIMYNVIDLIHMQI